ncbi:MAG TPA: hypothetical protein QF571_05820, partial [Desulfobacterales bacterium]|nr:hypothetical protein [Desulfobacterales bacterium]
LENIDIFILNYAALFPKTSSACPFANFRSTSLPSKWIFVLEKLKTPSYRSKISVCCSALPAEHSPIMVAQRKS